MAERDLELLATELLAVCGYGRYLQFNCTDSRVLRALLAKGLDAFGVIDTKRAQASDISDKLNTLFPQRIYSTSLDQLRFGDKQFECVVILGGLETYEEAELGELFVELRRIVKGSLYLEIDSDPSQGRSNNRIWWETLLFKTGFRKHTKYFEFNGYQELQFDTKIFRTLLEPVSETALQEFPLDSLAAERPLHMDMSRESGVRSDAHLIRYVLGTHYVRPNDIVIDAACGLGYGTHIVAANSPARLVIGLDNSPSAISYARTNFGGNRRLSFENHDLKDLSILADNSVDLILSFETIEHLVSPQSFLKEAKRVLRPSGRLILSVPNLWIDDTGKDPNPYHLHVYDWCRIKQEVQEEFLLEDCFAQDAGGGFKNPEAKRRLARILDQADEDCEWAIVVAMVTPTKKTGVPFKETVYPYSEPPVNLLQFSRDYIQPWLLRSLVECPFRIQNRNQLNYHAQEVLNCSPDDSADYGAALCVLGYRFLEEQELTAERVESFVEKVDGYTSKTPANPHITRWHLSLLFLSGELLKCVGNFKKSRKYFEKCLAIDPQLFSPILATKSILTARNLAALALSEGDYRQAEIELRRGVDQFFAVLSAERVEFEGKRDWPLSCNYLDTLELVNSGMYCMQGVAELRRLASFDIRPNELYRGDIKSRWTVTNRMCMKEVQGLKAELARVSQERDDWHSKVERRLTELSRIGKERDELLSGIVARDELIAQLQSSLTDCSKELAVYSHWTHRLVAAINSNFHRAKRAFFGGG